MRGLYVHIPFCVRKCAYCDFYSLPGRTELIGSYVQAVLSESTKYADLSFQTLYLGGGTPSLLGGRNLRTLVNGLRRSFSLSELVESTIEVNPESATAELLETAWDVGFNRVSIGVQSLSDGELKSVGRVHDAAQAIEAVTLALRLDFEVSVDIIIGLPGQNWQTLENSLETLTKLGVQHLSMYCLALEHGTPLALNPPDSLPSDDLQAELFELASSFLGREGFGHYEISNFARKGHECLHNLNYWRCGEYLGLGTAAASHLGGKRFKNRADLHAYLNNPIGQVEEVEELDAKEKAAEEAMLRLRLLSEGLDAGGLAERFGRENAAVVIGRLNGMAEKGLLVSDGSSYRLPPSRVLTSNPIFARVLLG
ncbi:MAG: radical SAM family heme chaperone HemW [Chloroflexi bacterium]|nr:radical SAM family heme chaperone HemW [Chloroflexota bacterium]